MEEQRIGMMYLRLARERVERIWQGLTGKDGRGSSLFPLLAVVLVLVVPGVIWVAHRHAKFHQLEEKVGGMPQEASGPKPGGRDPLVLTRARSGGEVPEFVSMTLLPGLGMSVLQISAYLPGRGETPLLLAPTPEQMVDAAYQPAGGLNDLRGALEVPWSGNLEGLPSPVGMTQSESWEGRSVSTPTGPTGPGGSLEGGLLHTRDSDRVLPVALSDGAGATAQFGSTDFDEHWFSRTETKVSVALHAASIDLQVVAKNVGDQPEPVGIGWHPRFAIVSGRRGEVTLRLPSAERVEYADKARHTPSGKILAAGAELEAFVGRGGSLGEDALDEGLVRLKSGSAREGAEGEGPTAEIRDAGARFGLRMVALSSSIRELRVDAPASASFVGLGPQTNYDSPLSRNWEGADAITTLQPGQSLEWRVRLEIFPLSGAAAGR